VKTGGEPETGKRNGRRSGNDTVNSTRTKRRDEENWVTAAPPKNTENQSPSGTVDPLGGRIHTRNKGPSVGLTNLTYFTEIWRIWDGPNLKCAGILFINLKIKN
jgi:hypothetical protein